MIKEILVFFNGKFLSFIKEKKIQNMTCNLAFLK
jgi:hypothetical protein